MNTMQFIDWAVLFSTVTFFIFLAYSTGKYVRSAADFLAANRLAGRYVLTWAEGIAGWGAIAVIASWQMTSKIGFGSGWWSGLGMPIVLLMNLTGWVIYRYRQTRAMTLAQFFEMRYSKNFRIFAGFICWVSGVLNFGIFPAVTANFFITYCGFPESYHIGTVAIPTYPTILIILIGMALYFTFAGGQIAVMVTDCGQSIFLSVIMASIVILLLIKFPLDRVFEGLLIAPQGKSMVNPFDAGKTEFNPWYFLIGIFGMIFNRMAWQSNQGYNCAAKSPHEAKMAGVLQGFRSSSFTTSITYIPLVAYLIMNHPDYAGMAQMVTEKLSLIGNEQIRDQMLTPMTMTLYVPMGLLGAFAAVMFLADISCNDTSLHAWGSMFVQDVILPLKKKSLTPQQHIKYLRASILFVGLFIFCFSCFFRQTQHILYFFAITGAIWLGGAGAVIIGGLYTKWGNTLGAYAALITGSAIAFTGMTCDKLWPKWYGQGHKFFLNGQEVFFAAMVIAGLMYVLFSLLSKRRSFNLDKMLHRGRFAEQNSNADSETSPVKSKWSLQKYIGITDEFTLGDKIIYGISIAQTCILFGLWVIMTALAVITPLSDRTWCKYHYCVFFYLITTSFIFAVWLGIFGLRDLFRLFRDLKIIKKDYADDGRVLEKTL